ncbi:hypothetical protein [Leucobacter musarum]|uniref:hypothetical protein n=1 Tax=Leucobacter musarum TaxID=1930747 RepID=UPI0006A78B40|nr:hypothetical protein [Leucobacter musarum]
MTSDRKYFRLIDGRTDEVRAVFCTDGAIEYRYDADRDTWSLLRGSTIGLSYQGGDPLLERVSFSETGATSEPI